MSILYTNFTFEHQWSINVTQDTEPLIYLVQTISKVHLKDKLDWHPLLDSGECLSSI